MSIGGLWADPAPKPILKWAGGKRQLLPEIRARLPLDVVENNHIQTYVEPFFGGGAVFFDLVQRFTIERAIIGDFNADLALVYRVVQSDQIQALIDVLHGWQITYDSLDEEARGVFFYARRDEYNLQRRSVGLLGPLTEQHVVRAATTVFLNRTCFNGLYRVNSDGDYNVPHGRSVSTNRTICDQPALLAAHRALQGVEIRTGSYEHMDDVIDDKAFVYLDPPYRPLPGTASFTDYIQKATFGDDDQRVLGGRFQEWHERGASLMLSNSDPKTTDPDDNFFDDLYAPFNVSRVDARRAINSDGEGRGPVSEILVTNY